MDKQLFSTLFNFQKKSKIKARDGLILGEGNYPFYTSSDTLTKSLNDYLFEEESLIFGTGGKASVHYCDNKFAVSTDCFVCQLKSKTNTFAKFVFYYLSGNIHLLEEGFKGAGLKHISKDYLSNLKIPLPPLDTQKKIAAILDEADKLRQLDKKLIKKYDALTQSLFLEVFGDPVTNPKRWEKKNIKKNCYKFCDGPFGSNLKSEHYVDTGVRVVRLQNIGVGRFNDKDKAFISSDYAKTLSKNHCLPGDILIGTMGEPNLRACMLPKDISLAINKADCLICRPNRSVFSEVYLVNLLNNKSFVNSLSDLILGQTRGRISMGRLSTRYVITPPLNLQNNFAERVQVIEEQKAQAQQSIQKSEELFNSLLQKAFKGELV